MDGFTRLILMCSLLATSAIVAAEPAVRQRSSQAPEPAARTRVLQPGDHWAYRVETKYPYTQQVRLNNGAVIPIRRNLVFGGTMDVTVVAVPMGNGPTSLALMKNLKFKRNDRDVDRTWLVYFEQDKDTGEITEVRKDPDTGAGTKLDCLVPGDWAVGKSYRSRPLFGIRPHFNCQFSPDEVAMPGIDEYFDSVVSEPENISVRAGRFAAWKVNRTETGVSDVASDNVWFAPEMGYFVKMVASIPTGRSDFPKCTEVVELASTSVRPVR